MDAVHLAQLFYKLELRPITFNHDELTQIRYSTRLFNAMSEMLTSTKLRAKSIINIIFPYYPDVFTGSFNRIFNRCLVEYPTAKSVINTPKEELRIFVAKAYGYSITCKTVENTTEKLIQAAVKCPTEIEGYDTQIHSLLFLIKSIQHQQDQLDELIQYIEEKLCHRQDYQIVNSIPGIGSILTATILSEIGDLSKFDSAKKLNAFAGIEPSVYQSGSFKANRNRISKRGSHYLRHALFIAVKCQIRGSLCPEIREYYDLKRSQGKAHKVAMVACMNKLLRIIYALLTKQEYYSSASLPDN